MYEIVYKIEEVEVPHYRVQVVLLNGEVIHTNLYSVIEYDSYFKHPHTGETVPETYHLTDIEQQFENLLTAVWIFDDEVNEYVKTDQIGVKKIKILNSDPYITKVKLFDKLIRRD